MDVNLDALMKNNINRTLIAYKLNYYDFNLLQKFHFATDLKENENTLIWIWNFVYHPYLCHKS